MPESTEKRTIIYCLLLVAATLTFYNRVVGNSFTEFDDSAYILKNAQVQSGLNWGTVKWAFTRFDVGNWHPLTSLSHALDCQIFHLNPAGHHYVNLLLHAASAVVLFMLLLGATGRLWPSLVVGALFALHPVNVESVAWIAERKNVLSMLFFLLALYTYDRYARTGKKGLYWGVVALFALGLLAKSQIVTLPFVVLLWDYWPLQRMKRETAVGAAVGGASFGYLVWEKVPLFVLAAADSVVTVVAQRAGGAVRTAGEFSMPSRVENALVSYVRYIGKMVWPVHLAPLYPHPGNSLPVWQVIGAAMVLLLISAFVLRQSQRRYLLFGWLWFLGTLVPVLGLVAVGEQAMADRFAYIPFIGLFIAVVWGVAEVGARYRIPNAAWVGVAVAVVLILGCVTYHQLGYWHDDETLWRYTLSVTDRNYMAHDNLALALARQGRADEAVIEFRAANALHKYPPAQVLALAMYEARVGHFREAVEECDSVLRVSNDPSLQAAAGELKGKAQLAIRGLDSPAKDSKE